MPMSSDGRKHGTKPVTPGPRQRKPSRSTHACGHVSRVARGYGRAAAAAAAAPPPPPPCRSWLGRRCCTREFWRRMAACSSSR